MNKQKTAYKFDSIHLGKAFMAELRGLGYEDETVIREYNRQRICPLVHSKPKGIAFVMNNSEADKQCEKSFQLETQWKEALEFAKAQLEEPELIKEAKEKGFVIGARFKQYKDHVAETIVSEPFIDTQGDIVVKTKSGHTLWIYNNAGLGDFGKWAKIVNTAKFFDWDVKEGKHIYHIGCKQYTKDFLKKLREAIGHIDRSATVRELQDELIKLDL